MHRLLTIAVLLAGCQVEAPAACTEMCQAATSLYGECLAEDGVDWTAAGYADGDDHQDRCETWAWEMAVLEDDAVARGDAEAEGATARVCAERRDILSADTAVCADYTDTDWNAPPW